MGRLHIHPLVFFFPLLGVEHIMVHMTIPHVSQPSYFSPSSTLRCHCTPEDRGCGSRRLTMMQRQHLTKRWCAYLPAVNGQASKENR